MEATELAREINAVPWVQFSDRNSEIEFDVIFAEALEDGTGIRVTKLHDPTEAQPMPVQHDIRPTGNWEVVRGLDGHFYIEFDGERGRRWLLTYAKAPSVDAEAAAFDKALKSMGETRASFLAADDSATE